VLAAVLAAGATAAGGAVGVAQAGKRFEAASGFALVRKPLASKPGRYVAFDLGVPTITKTARFGQFTVFVVTAGDRAAAVAELLADRHTGTLGPADARGLRWEQGRTLSGQRIWTAKRRYGANVVVWWVTAAGKRTDAAFARLHAALRATVAG
jgi:hypothetical protein